jgi:DGQHR domain-containing protein
MKTLSYFGVAVTQRASGDSPRFFSFYAKVTEILSWAGVKRTTEHEGGTQRVIKPARRAAVRRFLESDGKNTLPGSIIIGFRDDSIQFLPCPDYRGAEERNRCEGNLEYGKIELTFDDSLDPNDEKSSHLMPGLVVDGQHRLKGCGDFTPEDIPLLVVGILKSTPDEEAFQFIVINQKSQKVATTNIKSIIADLDYGEEALSDRLESAGIRFGESTPTLVRVNGDPDSPFYKMLDWERNDRDSKASRIIPVSAIEACIKHLQSSFEVLLEDRDSAEAVFIDIWSAIKGIYPDLWNGDDSNKLLKKVSIMAINDYITHDLLMKWATDTVDPLESEDLRRYVVGLFDPIPADFWTEEWTARVQDNANVRGMIQSDLEKIIVNSKIGTSWKRKLALISN